METQEDIDARLARLGSATERIGASPAFSARVMDAVLGEIRPSWLDLVRSASFRILPVAALAAVIALALAAESQRSLEETLAASYGAVDIE